MIMVSGPIGLLWHDYINKSQSKYIQMNLNITTLRTLSQVEVYIVPCIQYYRILVLYDVYVTLKAEFYRMSTFHGSFLQKVDFLYGMSTFYNQLAIESLHSIQNVDFLSGLGTEIKMNIDINFSITEIQVLNIDINFDISKFKF